MIALYGVYIMIMVHNETLKEKTTRLLASNPSTAFIVGGPGAVDVAGPDDVFGSSSSGGGITSFFSSGKHGINNNNIPMDATAYKKQTQIEEDSLYLAALLVVLKHKRLFRSTIRFQSAARYIIVKRQHRILKQQRAIASATDEQAGEADYFGADDLEQRGASGRKALSKTTSGQRAKMEAYAHGGAGSIAKNKFSIVSRDDYEFWNAPPAEGESKYDNMVYDKYTKDTQTVLY